MSLLQVSGISVQENGVSVLTDISFTQQEFQKIAIAGETGSGKSTLLQTIAGLVQPSAGEVRLEDERVRGPVEKLVPGHAGIAYLSQQFELPQFLRVEQVLKYANKIEAEEAEFLYDVCRIRHLMKRRTDQLSGGERQRIALARLLTGAPKLLLLDEPYSNLDTAHKNILKSVVKDIGEHLDITCTLISHDPQDTLSWADEILVIKNGKLLQQGTPEQIYRQPLNEYTAALFGAYNLLPATSVLATLPGIIQNGKKLLIRPESFEIASENSGLAGKVNNVSFYGSYYELDITLEDTTITVKQHNTTLTEGDPVCITVSPDKVWHI